MQPLLLSCASSPAQPCFGFLLRCARSPRKNPEIGGRGSRFSFTLRPFRLLMSILPPGPARYFYLARSRPRCFFRDLAKVNGCMQFKLSLCFWRQPDLSCCFSPVLLLHRSAVSLFILRPCVP